MVMFLPLMATEVSTGGLGRCFFFFCSCGNRSVAARRKRDRVRICFLLWLVRIAFGEFEVGVFAPETGGFPLAIRQPVAAFDGIALLLDQNVLFKRGNLTVVLKLGDVVVTARGRRQDFDYYFWVGCGHARAKQ